MTTTKQTELDVVGDALKELAKQFLEAWPDHTGKYYFLLGAGLEIAKAAQSAPEPVQGEAVAAQTRFRRPEKGTPDWSPWHETAVRKSHPAWHIDSQGFEVEYRLLYTAAAKPDAELVELLREVRGSISYERHYGLCDRIDAKLAELQS